MSVARRLYATVLWLSQPVWLARFWWRGRAEPAYRQWLSERWGRYRTTDAGGRLWLHAVSLGETRAMAPLLDELRRLRPGLRLLLTHGTATGREAGLALLREGDIQAWLPIDTPGATRRFLRQFRPRLGVLMETEIWPSLLESARRAQVPMVLANARLSVKSARQGERFSALLRPAAESLTLALAQTADDARRLGEAGVGAVEVCGNLKFDMAVDPALVARGRAWRATLGGRRVLMLAVSREGEEAKLLAAWRATFAGETAPLLLVVPRHPQRFDEVAALLQSAGLRTARRSAWGDAPPPDALQADAWLGDSMREMALYYGLADLALLGGSFAPLGGQNLIEAAACGCPLLMGPHTFNFADAAEAALALGAARRVADLAAALPVARGLLADGPALSAMAAQALVFAARDRGAAQRMAARIAALLPPA